MKITLLTVGKLKEAYLISAVQDYVSRLKPFSDVTMMEIKESLLPEHPSPKQIQHALDEEGQMILKQIQPKDRVIVLDLHQPQMDSLHLAKTLAAWQQKSSSWVFIMGSSHGLSILVKQKASTTWTLSALTFPHGIVRLLVLEQLYRAFKINTNQTYHK